MCLLFFESLLIFWHAEMSHTNPCPFPAPGLKSAIASRSTGPFQWRMVFRSQDLGVHALIATGISLFLGSFSKEDWKYIYFYFSLFSYIIWRRKWQPTPVFLPRESRGQRSLVGCCPQGCTESDTTEATQHACMHGGRKWQPTPVFLPGESEGQRSLMGCHLSGRTESDMTETTQQQQQQHI